mmetsp:Transcript_2746/g.4191  ORF Transcript_2746/g.4191 Transcript_2746/m.4191 type:complete len:317 (-) Transcript_2746:186-1136(-)
MTTKFAEVVDMSVHGGSSRSFWNVIFSTPLQFSPSCAYLKYGVAQRQGPRPHQEDRFIFKLGGVEEDTHTYFGVFDGHGGAECAEHVRDSLHDQIVNHPDFPTRLPEAIHHGVSVTDATWLQKCLQSSANISGTTGVFGFIIDNVLTVGNVGDSRCVLSRGGHAIELSIDQKPWRPDEKARIVRSGGWVDNHGMLLGYISMSRSFGDIAMKTFRPLQFPDVQLHDDVFICDPEIRQVTLSNEDEFIILASDGLWGRVTNAKAVKIARESLKKYQDPNRAAEDVIGEAYKEGSMDNTTVLIVIVNKYARSQGQGKWV